MKFWRKYTVARKNILFIIGLISIISSSALADGNLEMLSHKDPSVLQDPLYIKLKTEVISSLKGSWCSEEKVNLLMDLVLLEEPAICVEIGAFTGSSVLPVAAALKFLKKGEVVAIDAWSNEVAVKNWADNDPNKDWWSTLDMEVVSDSFYSMLESWELNSVCTVIPRPSEEAISLLDSIDFLHLDGDYSEKGSVQDVELYLPKVKSGGYILLSNLFTMINGKQPKMKAFCSLMDYCEIVCEIERDNAILFRKY